MPTPYFIDDEEEDLGRSILGGRYEQRSTKTRIKSDQMSAILTLVGTHYDRLLEIFHEGHLMETGHDLKEHELLKRYKTLRSWKRFHSHFLEHGFSVEGFGVDRVLRHESIKAMSSLQETQASVQAPQEGGEAPAKRKGLWR